jgi:hypothetical protein
MMEVLFHMHIVTINLSLTNIFLHHTLQLGDSQIVGKKVGLIREN